MERAIYIEKSELIETARKGVPESNAFKKIHPARIVIELLHAKYDSFCNYQFVLLLLVKLHTTKDGKWYLFPWYNLEYD